MKIKISQVGTNSLLGSYISERIKRKDNNYLDISEEVKFYIENIIPKVDLALEIRIFKEIYPNSLIKVFDIKSYEND